MKSFINVARLLVVSLLFVSLSALGFGCCPSKCATKCAPAGCKIAPEPVVIRKTCDHPGYYRQVCRLEYEPCEGKIEEVTAMPIFKGCFDETGNRIDNGFVAGYSNWNNNALQVRDVEIQTRVPAAYSQTTSKKVVRKTNGLVRKNGNVKSGALDMITYE